MQALDKVEIDSKGEATASVIWLHGLGADGYDFVDIVPQLQLPESANVRFIFPHAPQRPVTLNAGFTMRAWFDLYALDHTSRQDEQGIRESQKLIEELIVAEKARGVRSERIVLAGFSQGGAMALHCGLRFTEKLAGILVLSGFLLLDELLKSEASAENHDTPILMLHGKNDNVVPVEWAEWSKEKLLGNSFFVEWSTYPIAHGVCLEEIQRVGSWLRNLL